MDFKWRCVMREVGAFEAKNKLGTLLDWVASGEEVLITRHGKAVARLVPATPTFDSGEGAAGSARAPGGQPRRGRWAAGI